MSILGRNTEAFAIFDRASATKAHLDLRLIILADAGMHGIGELSNGAGSLSARILQLVDGGAQPFAKLEIEGNRLHSLFVGVYALFAR